MPHFAEMTDPRCCYEFDTSRTGAELVQFRWVEKYRPDTLDDLISHQDIINTIRKFVADDRLPHLLFYGPPGTGKTSTILAIAKQIYSPREISSMVLEASYKLVILDEADAMTTDAQNALRRVIEKFTENTRFCIICNYLSKIIPALQSRCMRFRFGPLTNEQIMPRLEYVIAQEQNITQIIYNARENVNATPLFLNADGKKALITLANGDMRKVLNVLQSCSMAYDNVTEDNVYLCVGHPLRKDIENIVNWMLSNDFKTCYNIDFPSHIRIELLDKMSDIEYRLSSGTSEKLQLSSLIAAFQVARNMVLQEAMTQ
ncbi:hypothetical protein NP493_165g03019 [Ridgeia piscesae]|uniref:AAA+ ATPase domain-containing protein n=1 Tax=Ridgeia piscesae TaxID=27915 RepID=A0AAD9P3E7_RIDPI|nr:hypothetical protein NP493_165g03019 [Ridgeia piscesae]